MCLRHSIPIRPMVGVSSLLALASGAALGTYDIPNAALDSSIPIDTPDSSMVAFTDPEYTMSNVGRVPILSDLEEVRVPQPNQPGLEKIPINDFSPHAPAPLPAPPPPPLTPEQKAAYAPPAPAPRTPPPLTPAQETAYGTGHHAQTATRVPEELQECWDLMQYLALVEPESAVSPREFADMGKELCRLASMAKGSRNERGAAQILAERQAQDEEETRTIAGSLLSKLHEKSASWGLAGSLIAFFLLSH